MSDARDLRRKEREKDKVDEMDGANSHPGDDERGNDKLSRAVERRKVERLPSRWRKVIIYDSCCRATKEMKTAKTSGQMRMYLIKGQHHDHCSRSLPKFFYHHRRLRKKLTLLAN